MTKQKTKNLKAKKKAAAKIARIAEKHKIAPGYGITTGLTFGQFIVRLFDDQVNKHRDDYRLIRKIKAEFPLKADVEYERYMNMYRNIYNRGEWPCQQGQVPANPIAKYDENGKAMKHGPGPAPRTEPLSVE